MSGEYIGEPRDQHACGGGRPTDERAEQGQPSDALVLEAPRRSVADKEEAAQPAPVGISERSMTSGRSCTRVAMAATTAVTIAASTAETRKSGWSVRGSWIW